MIQLERKEGCNLKKIYKIRRTGVLILSLGLGMLLGQMEPSWKIIGFSLTIILWLLFYDFAVEDYAKKGNKGLKSNPGKIEQQHNNYYVQNKS